MTAAEILKKCGQLADDPENKKFLTNVWIKMHKIGIQIPEPEELSRMIKGFCAQNDNVTLDGFEYVFISNCLDSLTGLLQLALVKERM